MFQHFYDIRVLKFSFKDYFHRSNLACQSSERGELIIVYKLPNKDLKCCDVEERDTYLITMLFKRHDKFLLVSLIFWLESTLGHHITDSSLECSILFSFQPGGFSASFLRFLDSLFCHFWSLCLFYHRNLVAQICQQVQILV